MRFIRSSPFWALSALSAVALLLSASSAQAQTLQKTAFTFDGNGNGAFEVGETVQYTLTFTNTAATELDSVVIRDSSSGCLGIETGSLVIEPASGGTDSSSGNDVQVDLVSPLPPGETVTITFTATATAFGECCNQATWSATGSSGGVSDLDPADFTADQPTCHAVVLSPGPDTDAIIDKQVLSAGCLAPGSTVDFRIHIQNTGRRPLRNVAFSDILVPGFSDIVVGGGLTYDPAANRVYMDGGTWGVGETTEYTYSAVLPCTASGTLSNTATLTFEDNGGNVFQRSDTETVTWGQPDISDSTKRWADDPADGDAILSPGENITFTIAILNSGSCEALNVLVLDDLDPRFMSSAPTLVISDGGFYDGATGRIEWNETTTPQLAAIQPGGSVTLSVTTQVEPGTREGDFIPNSVTITPLGNDSSCPGLPSVTRTIAMQNGDVPYGVVAPRAVLLRNDFVSCSFGVSDTIHGVMPAGPPVLRERTGQQECSNPPAINAAHPQTDVIINPISPYFFADATWMDERCPQNSTGSGGVLVFYELQDDCTTTLRVTKHPVNRSYLVVSW